jgi:hypothetical protein
MLVQIIKPVSPAGERAEAVVTYDIAYSTGGCGSVALGGPPGEYFLQAIKQSARRSTLQQ